MSTETLEFHYGKHHQTYVNKLNELTNNEKSNDDLEKVVLEAEQATPLFNNAAQVWNHTFFWNCMKPGGGGKPNGALSDALNEAFGSVDDFLDKLTQAAVGQFGSGWAWLAHDGSKLQVLSTANADLPLKHGAKALLTVDVWEHAYYIDHRNARPAYLETFLGNLVNWDFVEENLKSV